MFLDGGNVFGVAANPTHAYPVSENHTSPNALSTKCAAAASHVEECKRSDAETMSALDLLAPAHQPAQIIELFRSACTVEGADGGEPHTPFTPPCACIRSGWERSSASSSVQSCGENSV